MAANKPLWLSRTDLLLGEERLERLKNAHVLVVGLGGVGAYAAEMLCRAGIGELTIVDADIIEETNINRQQPALHSTVGFAKADILHARFLDINPKLKINPIIEFICDDRTDELLNNNYDYVVDAIDTLSPKANLIAKAMARGIPIVSSMGAGGKLDPTRVSVTDISKSHHCPLAHMLRKRLSRMGIKEGFKVVFSDEENQPNSIIITNGEGNKKSNVGTISYMPAVFGICCASAVIRDLAQ
ncbi:tRNA threonylcarbamoyladenosine dehydratase [Williamwhitmania taraxaci]|uniref:tRNA A37 threonylcarbamoyladenosine dehydratase n=1 Tax=Williamwhitmania taraxaci TaxID=1640674 RepID=A0A1G6SFD7_9BACT|nr:tRNA threonylcarbamoyladenosine dehydratase [Williamwhitmania taraxaci]SDD14825.1 tRNA A37 threonylcarbamoyladenosine dehydratase [Williamwhitmania taraxaci]